MNCLDYRRVLLAGEGETEAMRAHRLGCAACTETHRDHLAFESELRAALEVPIPEGFEARLAGKGTAPAHPGRRRWLAAASVAALAAGAGLYAWRERDDPMAMACIDFVMKDEAKSLMMGSMPRAEAARMLADTLPLERIERIGRVQHVAPCPLGEGTAYHVVLMVPQDKVTLLVMPDTPMPKRGKAAHHGMHSTVVPMRNGSVGVVGANAAVVASVVGAIGA